MESKQVDMMANLYPNSATKIHSNYPDLWLKTWLWSGPMTTPILMKPCGLTLGTSMGRAWRKTHVYVAPSSTSKRLCNGMTSTPLTSSWPIIVSLLEASTWLEIYTWPWSKYFGAKFQPWIVSSIIKTKCFSPKSRYVSIWNFSWFIAKRKCLAKESLEIVLQRP